MSSSPIQRPKFDLAEEFRIIPTIAVVLASAAFLCMQWVWHVFMLMHEHNPPPAPLRTFMAFFTGVLLAMYILMVGYVNADSKRRGMNRTLWTLLVMFIPNAIGFVVYFFVRQPLIAPCPRCGNAVQAGFRFCPACQYQLVPLCTSCGTPLQPGFSWCPGCGKPVGAAAQTPATPK